MNGLLQQLGYLFFVLLVASCFVVISAVIGCNPTSNQKNEEETLSIEHNPKLYTVEIAQMAFSPSEITVEKGDTVIFVNHDLVTHDITEASSNSWSSSPLQPEQSWKLEVDNAVNYYCSLHPVMKGSINVR